MHLNQEFLNKHIRYLAEYMFKVMTLNRGANRHNPVYSVPLHSDLAHVPSVEFNDLIMKPVIDIIREKHKMNLRTTYLQLPKRFNPVWRSGQEYCNGMIVFEKIPLRVA